MTIKTASVMWCATVLGISFCTPAFAAHVNRDQYQDRDRSEERRHFTDHDRRVLNDWYRDHADRFESEFREGRWNNEELDRRLQPGNVMDEDLRRWARPVSDKLAGRLDPLPPDWQYERVGYNVCIVDRDGTIRDRYHFDRDQYNDQSRFHFSEHDRQVMGDWNRDHQNAVNQFLNNFGMRMENDDLDRRLQVGNTVDPDLRDRGRPAPESLVEQLSTPPPGWHYVVIGDRLCVVDREWRIHESYHFQH